MPELAGTAGGRRPSSCASRSTRTRSDRSRRRRRRWDDLLFRRVVAACWRSRFQVGARTSSRSTTRPSGPRRRRSPSTSLRDRRRRPRHGAPALPIIDSLQFQHEYLTTAETRSSSSSRSSPARTRVSSAAGICRCRRIRGSVPPRIRAEYRSSTRAAATSVSARFRRWCGYPRRFRSRGRLRCFASGWLVCWAVRRDRAVSAA